MVRSGEAVMEKVRRYRAIASLHRQTAAFRPHQRWSLLSQAEEWERLAVEQLEAYFSPRNGRYDVPEPRVARSAGLRWETSAGCESEMSSMRHAMRLESATAWAA